jgi:hypothetical protein
MINKGIYRTSLITEMGVWKRCVRKTLQNKVHNAIIREEKSKKQ